MLKLKLQYFGHLMGRTDSFEKTLKGSVMLERLKAEGKGEDGEWSGWMASPTWWTWIWVSSGSWWWTEKPGMLQSMGSQRVGHDWATELNWWNNGINQDGISYLSQHFTSTVVIQIKSLSSRLRFSSRYYQTFIILSESTCWDSFPHGSAGKEPPLPM